MLLLFSECVAPAGLAWDARRVGVDNDDATGCAERTGWSARVTFDGVVHADDVVDFGGVLAPG